MKKTGLSGLIFLVLFSSAGFLFADIHVKSETSRLYMDFETKDVNEIWLAEGKSCRKVRNRIYITREDLNVRWLVDSAKKTYMELKLNGGQQPQEAPEEDIHTVGMFYSPEYDWEMIDTGEEKEIDGFLCRLFVAEGDADFAEIVAQYWICVDEKVKGGREYRRYMAEQMKNDSQRPKLYSLLKGYEGRFPVYREETIENAIAPTMVYKIRLLALEEAEAPPGIYDIPEGYTKIER